MTIRRWVGVGLVLVCVLGCGAAGDEPEAASETSARHEWAVAIHGGAGKIPRDMDAELRDAHLARLGEVLDQATQALAGGGQALDAVEQAVAALEDDPMFNAGRGSVLTHEGRHELDAAIMDGRSRACGSVAAVTTVRNPVRLARLVMERSPHVFLMGAGAESFAAEQGVEAVANSYFTTERRRQQLEEALAREAAEPATGTVGAVAMDLRGNLAAATSTGGMTNKRWGRVGDVPVIGAGTFADNGSCAVSATGHGEQFIRHTVASSIAALVELRGLPLEEAARQVIFETLEPEAGGVIAVDHAGNVAMVFSSLGMYRAAADSEGLREVRIWE